MTSRSFTIFTGCFTIAGLAVALAGCPDPEGAFEEFDERYKAIDHSTTTTGSGGGAECIPTAAGEADGRYMFALSATLDAKQPISLEATVVTTASGDGLAVDLDLQPLSAADQSTPVGDLISFTGLAVAADGSFTWDLGTVDVPGEANGISGSPIQATLSISGEICGGDRAGFICGDVTGALIKPFDFDLVGSTFTMQAEVDGMLPFPVINCAKDPAVFD